MCRVQHIPCRCRQLCSLAQPSWGPTGLGSQRDTQNTHGCKGEQPSVWGPRIMQRCGASRRGRSFLQANSTPSPLPDMIPETNCGEKTNATDTRRLSGHGRPLKNRVWKRKATAPSRARRSRIRLAPKDSTLASLPSFFCIAYLRCRCDVSGERSTEEAGEGIPLPKGLVVRARAHQGLSDLGSRRRFFFWICYRGSRVATSAARAGERPQSRC